jgi:hypothetical protein
MSAKRTPAPTGLAHDLDSLLPRAAAGANGSTGGVLDPRR